MNKNEKSIILNTYKEAYHCHNILNIDKTEVLYTLKFMVDSLGLKRERYIVENGIISEKLNLTSLEIQMYEMIFESFEKYGDYINYDLNQIDELYDDLKYQMTEEENKCHLARIKYLMDRVA